VVSSSFQSEDTSATETLAQWRSQTGQDLHSFVASASALFVNAAGNDYHLSSTSPAIDAGTATDAPPTDLDGNSRPRGNGYDIGCYEFGGTIAPPPPVSLTGLTLSPTSVVGGVSSTGTVMLSSGAPSGGAVVSLTSSNTAAATVLASVSLPAGASTATFTISTKSVTATTTAAIKATYQSVTKSSTLTVTAPAPPPPTGQTLAPTANAFVQAGSSANTNFGNKSPLVVETAASNSTNSHNRCTYLKFDLTTVKTAPTSAKLNLTLNSGSDPGTETISVYSVASTSWTETGITWNNAPGLNRTNCTSTGTLPVQQSVVLQPGTVSFDVTSFIKANIGKVVILQLICPSVQGLYGDFNSREASSGQPNLTVKF